MAIKMMPTSTMVKSPAGEQIEIVPDDDWMALTGASEQAMRMWQSKSAILASLWNHGAFSDKHGGAGIELHEHALAHYGYPATSKGAVSGLLKNPAMMPAVERNVRGKRTYNLRLVALPETWYRKLDTTWPHLNGHKPTTVPEPAQEDREALDDSPTPEPSPEPVDDYVPAVELEIASSVAMALLTQVVDIISAGTPDAGKVRRLEADLADVAERLSERLAENDRMRKTIRDLGDEVIALKAERDGLRKRARLAEENLGKASNVDVTRIVNERVQKELAKIMMARPGTHKGADET